MCVYVAVLQMFVKLSVEVVVAVSSKDLVTACRSRPLDWLSERILFWAEKEFMYSYNMKYLSGLSMVSIMLILVLVSVWITAQVCFTCPICLQCPTFQ